MTFHFKVGDIVKLTGAGLVDAEFSDDYDSVSRFTVTRVGHRIGGSDWLNYELADSYGDTLFVRSKWITMCDECMAGKAADTTGRHTELSEPDEQQSFKQAQVAEKSKPMGVLTTLRDLARSPEDRLFRKYSVVDECGDLTPAGKELLIELLFNDNKDAIVTQLKAVEAEEKKNKKS